MLDQRMQDAFNKQINWEFYSGYLYLSMASKFADTGMSGGQSWMTVQYQEELAHARIMFTYVLTRGGRVLLEAIEKPEADWPSGLAMFEEALAHEEGVTARIHDMASLALELKDHATYNFLQWFIAEQVEEEETAMDMVQKFKMAGEHPAGLYQLDKELATRVYAAPSPLVALDAAAAGVATVARTAHALRLATDTLRKVRFDAITGRLHEYVSRVARDQARPVRWALYGGSEHLDRTLLDKLAEPVEQLLRLSIEHGIEPALERQQAAKPAAGYVELRVSRQVDGLAIDVSDDGAPLDFASLRAQAGRLGLPALGAPPTAEQLEALLTAPGLIAAQTAQAGNPTLRRAATWAQLLAALHALGGSLELPLEAPGRNTVRVVLRD